MVGEARRVEKPWGFEIWWAHTDLYAGKVLHVEAGHRLSLQYHRCKDESCYLLSGRIRLITGSTVHDLDTVELGPASTWRNPPGQVHTIEAVETSEVLEVSTPQLDDVVRLLDDYGRADGGSEEASATVTADPPRLLDPEQIAAQLGMTREHFRRLASEPGFPVPAGYFRGRKLWSETIVTELRTATADRSNVSLSA